MEKLEPLKHITNIQSGSDKPLEVGDIKKTLEAESNKPYITAADLFKADVRICRIVSVTDIRKNPKKEPSDENPVKAYHLEIETGFDRRDVVTNIVDKYTKEDLLNKEVAFVLNLEPSLQRGVLSKGMIILAGDNLITGRTGDVIL